MGTGGQGPHFHASTLPWEVEPIIRVERREEPGHRPLEHHGEGEKFGSVEVASPRFGGGDDLLRPHAAQSGLCLRRGRRPGRESPAA
jgi:hypothetical protein